ncbi:MAG: hypothetical protein RMM58_08960 [Chloroflexota bacterium]|nr:hypothetical protein [Dehalococcoidia bacterium]MDW8253995.1 hypothetical protein [Chloroflexota bacterium]
MKSTEMSLQDAAAIFDHDENYPLTVIVDGVARQLDAEGVADLRRRRIPFEIDEAEAARLLIKYGTC